MFSYFVLFFGPAFAAAALQLASHLLVLHYFPNLDKIPRYVLGTVCMLGPLSLLLADQGMWSILAIIWLNVAASGSVVIGMSYLGNKYNQTRDQLDELERLKMRELLDSWDAKAKEE